MIDYVKEVNDYGCKLDPVAKQVARDVFSRLLEEGYDYEWLYFAVMNLDQRDISRHRGLFFYKPFQEEVAAMVVANRVAEEEKRQRSAQICAAIEKQIQQARQQKVITVKMQKPKPRRSKLSAAEMLAMVDDQEELINGNSE